MEPLQMDDSFPKEGALSLQQNLESSDSTTIHNKLSSYEQLNTEQRLSIVKSMPIILEQLGSEGLLVLKSILAQIIKDHCEIAQQMLDKLPEVVNYMQKHENFLDNLKNMIIPTIISYLNFNQLDIKQEAGKQLGVLAHRLTDKDRGDFVLRHVIQMAHDDTNEDNRIVAVQLFSSMSECFGKDLCEQFIGLEILSLGQDISFKVQKQAIKHLPIISKLLSPQFFQRFFAFFHHKASDKQNWAIRKACVDNIIDMNELCNNEDKQQTMSTIMLNLLKDHNKWVKISAYKNLGKFIHSNKSTEMNEKLIHEFCRMADNDVNNIGKENQIIYSCAYNFPAVLDAIGQQRWESDLLRVYEKLLKVNDKRIKKTLSESLHEVAKIIGQKNTEKYLFKVADTFFKDKNDEIKLGMIRNMSEIMHVLSPQKRQSLIGVFEQFQKDQKKWRIRECICKQLDRILQIYSEQTIFQYVVPILLKFCSDSVFLVRQQAANKIGDFIMKLSNQKHLLIGLIQSIKAFGTSPKYTQRQTFLIMCKKLMDHKEIFEEHFLEILINLANDKVLNVRMVLVEVLQNHINNKGKLVEEECFINLVNKLKADQNEQIRIMFQNQ